MAEAQNEYHSSLAEVLRLPVVEAASVLDAGWLAASDAELEEGQQGDGYLICYQRTWVYNNASSEPVPVLFALNNTQKTLHHLEEGTCECL